MNEGNYIKVFRSMLEWEWYKRINTKVLFLHMLLKANWKDAKFQGYTVPRGSFVSSIAKLSEETELTEREIRTAISHLKSTGEVTSKTTNRYTIFTVVKYDLYQSNDTQIDMQETGNRHSIDKLTTTIEEGKKEKREEGNTPPISPTTRFEDFVAAYPKQVRNRAVVEQAYCKLLLDDCHLKESELIIAAENYAEAVSILGTEERYIKNPANFLKDNFFVDYLDGNYVKPKPDKKKHGFDAGMMRQNYGDMSELEKELLSN